MIDFRSDTVTRPTKGMKEAMFKAELGDDVFQDDPTVNALELKAAELFGVEGALFCPSGTMTNQIAIKVHTQPGDQVICGDLAHIYHYEGGGIALNSGASVRLLRGDKGRFTAQEVEKNILNYNDVHFPISRMVAVENTSNKGGGVVWDNAELERIKKVCISNGLAFHLDGARVFNALRVTGQSTRSVGEMFDSISICLSKGLGCPVGSLLLGNQDFIFKARRFRKVFGGGMRQAGLLAAAGIYALDHHVERLDEDHHHAALLGDAVEQASWCKSIVAPETNILIAHLKDEIDDQELLDSLEKQGIKTVGLGKGIIRFVTHLDISKEEINKACDSIVKM